MDWIYKNNFNNTCRYVLGIPGKKPLICFGINPSTAEPEALDRTMQSVDRIAKNNGYDSWIMLNIYPQRATNPNDMDKDMNTDIYNENIKMIEEILSHNPGAIWAAWGNLISKRTYLKDCLKKIVEISHKYDCQWVSYGNQSKTGHPHHPLYLKKDEPEKEFNIIDYIEKLD